MSKEKKSLVLFIELSGNHNGNTSSGPLAHLRLGDDGWYWEDWRNPRRDVTKGGFATYQDALADLLSAMGLASGFASE